MRCSRNEFFSLIVPWCGKRGLVIVETEHVVLRSVWTLDTVSGDLVLKLSDNTDGNLTLDLSSSDLFDFGDSREAPKSLQELGIDEAFESFALAAAPGKLRVMFCLFRE